MSLSTPSTGDASGWAPPEAFREILRYCVVPTLDVILHTPDGVLLARRRIAPYRDKWALPGLRVRKGESIEACLRRITANEVGATVDVRDRRLVHQAMGRFRTEEGRQDLSTSYAFKLEAFEPRLNQQHFSAWRFIDPAGPLPSTLAALYRSHLRTFVEDQK